MGGEQSRKRSRFCVLYISADRNVSAQAPYSQGRSSWVRSEWGKFDLDVEGTLSRIGRLLWTRAEAAFSDVHTLPTMETYTEQAILTPPASIYPLPFAWLIMPVLRTMLERVTWSRQRNDSQIGLASSWFRSVLREGPAWSASLEAKGGGYDASGAAMRRRSNAVAMVKSGKWSKVEVKIDPNVDKVDRSQYRQGFLLWFASCRPGCTAVSIASIRSLGTHGKLKFKYDTQRQDIDAFIIYKFGQDPGRVASYRFRGG